MFGLVSSLTSCIWPPPPPGSEEEEDEEEDEEEERGKRRRRDEASGGRLGTTTSSLTPPYNSKYNYYAPQTLTQTFMKILSHNTSHQHNVLEFE